ncbi:hypothetical protein KW782_04515 [Candidatus Parcubacteria bacterium]|nr:hypothetical protein [Candidatus Parcubacteria bacterium]
MTFPINLQFEALSGITQMGIYSPIFYSFLFLHVVSFIIAFGSVIFIDTCGLLWILKKVKMSFVNSVADIGTKLIWTGLSGLVISGTVLILFKGYIDQLTAIKLFFVALVALNGINLHFIKKSSAHITDTDEMPALIRFRITVASTISQISWWGAVTIGFVHRHIQHNIPYPTNPWLWMVGILITISTIAILGEVILRKSPAPNASYTKI